jgi:hypothetical protein
MFIIPLTVTFRGVASGVQVKIDKYPDTCPQCHHAAEMRQIGAGHKSLVPNGTDRLEIIFQCPRELCQKFSIATYFRARSAVGDEIYSYYGSQPQQLKDGSFSPTIQKISPDFCQILNQAQKTEQQQWTMVAGPGYRKALEFLVKDYLCGLDPAKKETIQATQLGSLIANNIGHPKIKAIATRATWLGNDETHYLRKWVGKDLDDLKNLIELTVHWIEIEEHTKDVIEDMPEGKK